MAELAECFGLYLADALTGNIELLTDLLKGAGAAVNNAEAQLKNFLFTGSEGVEDFHKLLFKK